MTLLVVAIVVMFVLSPLLSLVVVVFVPVFAFVAVRFRDRVFPASWNDQRLSGAVAGVVDEAVTGVRVVKAFAQEQREFDRLDRAGPRAVPVADAHRPLQRPLLLDAAGAADARPSSACSPSAAGWRCDGHITLGVFLAFASYLVQIITPVRLVVEHAGHDASRPAPAPSGSSSCSTCSPRVTDAPRRPAGGRSPRRHRARPRRASATGDGPPTAARRLADDPPRRAHRARRRVGLGQDDAGLPDRPLLRPDVRHGPPRRHRRPRASRSSRCARRSTSCSRRASCSPRPSARTSPSADPAPATPTSRRRRASPQAHEFILELPRRLRHRRRRARLHAVGRPAPAHRPRPRRARQPEGARPRRRHVGHRRPHRGGASTPPWRPSCGARTTVLIAHRSSTLRLADRVIVLDGGRIVAEGTNAELWHTSALYRELLTGPELRAGRTSTPSSTRSTPTPGRRASADGDGAIAPRSSWRRSCRAWRPAVAATRSASSGLAPASSPRRPSCWPRSTRCRRCTATPTSTSSTPTAEDGSSSLRRLAHRFRWALLAVAALVARRRRHDARRAAAHPPRPRRRRRRRQRRACCWRCASSSSRSSCSAGATRSSSCCTRRARGADAVHAAGPHVRPPPAAVARLLRPGDGRADHDPHDHRRRGAGPSCCSRACCWRSRASSAASAWSSSCSCSTCAWPSWRSSCCRSWSAVTGVVPARARALSYLRARDAISTVNAELQESVAGVRVTQSLGRDRQQRRALRGPLGRVPRRPPALDAADVDLLRRQPVAQHRRQGPRALVRRPPHRHRHAERRAC